MKHLFCAYCAHIIMLCMPIMSNAVINTSQPQSPLYHNNLLTKEKLLYRGDIEDLWSAIEELRGAVFIPDRYLYSFENYKTSYCQQSYLGPLYLGVFETSWTPDGRFIAFTTKNEVWINYNKEYHSEVNIAAIDNGSFSSNQLNYTLANYGGTMWNMAWSPFFNENYYYLGILDTHTTNNQILLYRFNGETTITYLENLPKASTLLNGEIQRFTWSNNGEHIALTGIDTSGTLKLHMFACDPESVGSKFSSLTSIDITTTSTLHTAGISGLACNKDNYIAVSYYEINENIHEQQALKIFAFNGSLLTLATSLNIDINTENTRLNRLTWSPNGLYLTLILQDNSITIYKFNATTNTLTQLIHTNTFQTISNITWSPDSRYIAFIYRNSLASSFQLQIYEFNEMRQGNYKLLLEQNRNVSLQSAGRIDWSNQYQNYSALSCSTFFGDGYVGGSFGFAAPVFGYPSIANAPLYDFWKDKNTKLDNTIFTNQDYLDNVSLQQEDMQQRLWDRYILKTLSTQDFTNVPIGGPNLHLENATWSSDGQFLLFSNEGIKIFTVNEEGTLDPTYIVDTSAYWTTNATWHPYKHDYIFVKTIETIDEPEVQRLSKNQVYTFNPNALPSERLQLLDEINIELPPGLPEPEYPGPFEEDWELILGDMACSPDGNFIAQIAIGRQMMGSEDMRFWMLKIHKFDPTQTPALSLHYEYQSPMGENGPSQISWPSSNIIAWKKNATIIDFYSFNPTISTMQDRLVFFNSTNLPYDEHYWHPNGKYLIALEKETRNKIFVYAFNQETAILEHIYTAEDARYQNYRKGSWDSIGSHFIGISNNKAVLYSFLPQSKNILTFVKENIIHGDDTGAKIAWSAPYNEVTNLFIYRSFLEGFNWKLPLTGATLANDISERAIEVSTGSTLFDFKTSSTFDGEHKTYVFSATNQQLINVAPNQTVSFKNIIMQNFNFNTINLQENTSLFFDNQTTLALDGNQYEINRTYTFKGNCTINGNNSTLIFGPQAGFFIDKNATLLLQNITIKGLSDEQIRCMDCTSTVSFSGSVDFFMDNDYYFKHGRLVLTPASHVNINNEYEFIYQSPCASIIGSAAMLQMTRNATFSYDPQDENRDLIQFASDDGIFSLKGATLVSSATGMRLTYGTFKINGENNYLYSSGTTLSDSIMLGNGIYEDNLLCQFEGGNVGIINGKVIWANVEEPTP
ncbi:MAG: WD40 repeat, subgroup [candidate division TM6 bacterium GW2011_GWF2_38_10]|nr:MAG: WD40 repeat, subgroup [candidate division TM6 bacterium GW2011_GWF2_38_10]